MDSGLQLRVQRYGWDLSAEQYEPSWAEQLAGAQHRLLLAAGARPGDHVLDVACGTGLVTFPLADRVGEGGYVLGTDISKEMVHAAREQAGIMELNHVAFERMGAEQLALEDRRFDLAVCSLGLMYVPDPGRAMTEMHRILKPGGRVALLVWGQRRNCGWAEVFPIVDARVQSEVCPMFFRLGHPSVLRAELEGAGFTNVHLETLQETIRFGSAEDACLAAFEAGPVSLAYKRFDKATRIEVHREYLDSIAPYRTGEAYEIPGEFVIAIALKA